jgi:hypothetical protein
MALWHRDAGGHLFNTDVMSNIVASDGKLTGYYPEDGVALIIRTGRQSAKSVMRQLYTAICSRTSLDLLDPNELPTKGSASDASPTAAGQ